MSKLRKTVRDLHRRGTEAHAIVEQAAGGLASVRLSRYGARYTNLPVIGRVEAGDRVIVDFSLVDRPYVRPETVDEAIVVDVSELKATEAPKTPPESQYVSQVTGGKGKSLWHGTLWSGYNDPPPAGWYELDYDDSGWGSVYDIYASPHWPTAYDYMKYDGIPEAVPISAYPGYTGYYAESLVRHTIYIEEISQVPFAELIFDYDDILHGFYLNGTLIYGPDYTKEKQHGKPGGPFVLNVSDLLLEGKNVFAMWSQEQWGVIWGWANPARQFMIYKLTLNRTSQVDELLQDESITTVRALDTGTSLAPYSSGAYIPSFDSIQWGDEAYLEENPAAIGSIGLTAGNSHVYLGSILGKYLVSVQFNVQVPDAASYPRTDLDVYVYVVWSYPGTTGYTSSDWAYATRELWVPNSTAVVPVTFSGHFAISDPNAYIFPRIVRGTTPTNEPDTMIISDLKFDVMKIATISESPRSTYGSHWDEWYEKYPEEL